MCPAKGDEHKYSCGACHDCACTSKTNDSFCSHDVAGGKQNIDLTFLTTASSPLLMTQLSSCWRDGLARNTHDLGEWVS